MVLPISRHNCVEISSPLARAQAAAFLSKFVGNVPWVHLDIAGPSWLTKDKPYISKGASGVGVRLMVQVLRDLAAGKTRETGR